MGVLFVLGEGGRELLLTCSDFVALGAFNHASCNRESLAPNSMVTCGLAIRSTYQLGSVDEPAFEAKIAQESSSGWQVSG